MYKQRIETRKIAFFSLRSLCLCGLKVIHTTTQILLTKNQENNLATIFTNQS